MIKKTKTEEAYTSLLAKAAKAETRKKLNAMLK